MNIYSSNIFANGFLKFDLAAALHTANETPKIAFAPNLFLLFVPSNQSNPYLFHFDQRVICLKNI